MAAIARNFGAKIIKNVGDSLLFYFPQTSDSSNDAAFKNVFECCLLMLEARTIINANLAQEGILPIHYRISADYGKVELAKSISSKDDDLFGLTLNLCVKINKLAEPDGMIIGEDLYQIFRSHGLTNDNYDFQEGDNYVLGLKSYTLYKLITKYFKNDSSSISPSLQEKLSLMLESRQSKKKPTSNIMIVDDDEDALLTFKSFLSEKGYNVDTFRSAEEAISHFMSVDPSYYDLVLTDIRMNPINGLQFYNRIKGLNAEIKVIFISALDAAKELTSMLPEVKHSEILKKPVKRDHFITTVTDALS